MEQNINKEVRHWVSTYNLASYIAKLIIEQKLLLFWIFYRGLFVGPFSPLEARRRSSQKKKNKNKNKKNKNKNKKNKNKKNKKKKTVYTRRNHSIVFDKCTCKYSVHHDW